MTLVIRDAPAGSGKRAGGLLSRRGDLGGDLGGRGHRGGTAAPVRPAVGPWPALAPSVTWGRLGKVGSEAACCSPRENRSESGAGDSVVSCPHQLERRQRCEGQRCRKNFVCWTQASQPEHLGIHLTSRLVELLWALFLPRLVLRPDSTRHLVRQRTITLADRSASTPALSFDFA